MGDILRTRLNVAGNTEFIVKTRNAPDQTRLTVGEVIEIGGYRKIVVRLTHDDFSTLKLPACRARACKPTGRR